ncbi:hypothetical protein CF160_03675 [Enterococcus pseudoavium]|nr:hypothetical protein CF160_03675 [Enterococcus pseudoavium]
MWQKYHRKLSRMKSAEDIILQEYSNKILKKLDLLIENVSPTNLKTTIATINGIQEKLYLLLFFLA